MKPKHLPFAVAAVLLAASVSHADSINVDQDLWQSDLANPSVLAASVDMSYNATTNVLTIDLANVSTALAVQSDGTPSASALLTGLGFVLPTGMAIAGGSVSMAGSTAINWTNTSDDVSVEWGYDNSPLQSGVLLSMSDYPLTTGVSTMESGSDTRFSLGPPSSLGGAAGLNGPDFGLYSHTAVSAGSVGGVKGIDDSVVITLNLSGSYSGTSLTGFIDRNHVVATWGSPDSGGDVVPEPGTIALLGAGILGLAIYRRRRKS
jgi:hypothetical protein